MCFSGIYYIYSVGQSAPLSSSQTFPSPSKGQPISLAITPHVPSPSPWQPQIYFLSLWICLFWIFHINGITYKLLCLGFLHARSMVFLRFIHIIAWISAPFLFWLVIFFCMDGSHCVYPFIHWWTLGLFLPFPFFFWPQLTAGRILVPQTGIEPSPLQWKLEALTTGPPENSFVSTFWRLGLVILWTCVCKNSWKHLLSVWCGWDGVDPQEWSSCVMLQCYI